MSLVDKKYGTKELKELARNMKACPFCHDVKCKITKISAGAYKGNYYQGLCNKCYARGPKVYNNAEEALEKWNNR